MKIGIDATGLGGSKTGTSVYLAEILRVWNRDTSIAHEFIVFASNKAISHMSEIGLDHRFRFVAAPDNRYLRTLWQQTVMPWKILRLGIQVHWGTGFVLPLASAKPMVLTVHDLSFQLFPGVHERIKRHYFPAIIKAGVAKARAVIAVSESTRSDLSRLIPASQGKTTTTLLAARHLEETPGDRGSRTEKRADRDYVLFVGTLEPRKNLSRLISAWQSLAPSTRGKTRLIVVGATGWLVDELVGRLNDIDSVEFRGHVSDAELAHLLHGAAAFLYPSLYEGFGLPVVEAMAQGIPVLTSDVGATREVAGGAAVLVDPSSVPDIGAGLTRLLTEPALRVSLCAAGKQRAASFSWERTGRKTLAIIERVAQQ